MASSPAPASTPLPEPLRLPRGTVRGLLSVLLMGTFAYLLTRDAIAPTVLVNAVVVCLAFYFGSHAAPVVAPQTSGGTAARPRRPRVVHALLIVGFAGLAGWFLYHGTPPNQLPPELVQIWEVLGGYLIGLTLSWIIHRRSRVSDLRRRLATFFRDLSAAAAIAFTLFACYAMVTGLATTFGRTVEEGLSLVITYYFGSRVLAH